MRVTLRKQKRRSFRKLLLQIVESKISHRSAQRIAVDDLPAALGFLEQHGDVVDAQIVAIALSRRAGLATRNVSDFEECGLTLTNPWSAS